MRYLPKSAADREAMLKAIGLRSVDELFAPIPAEYRLSRDLKVPRQMAESEIVDYFRQRSRENGEGYTSFLGAGAYSHYRPVIIDSSRRIRPTRLRSRRARCNPFLSFRR
jgi:glycine dehydrogenase subunit 1